jgi:hypothetical protein
MVAPIERVKKVRGQRPIRRLGGLRLVVPDARSKLVRQGVAIEVAGLDPHDEQKALNWVETDSEFDEAW